MRIATHSFAFEQGDETLLNNEATIKSLLYDIVEIARLTPLDYSAHKFEPQGISATLILAESHIAIHTWPEQGSGYVILTSCVTQEDAFIASAAALIGKSFGATLRIAKELR